MESTSRERRNALIAEARDIRKLELRDGYGIDDPLFEAWRSGDQETLDRFAAEIRAEIEAETEAGVKTRRIKVVSEPLSEYHRFILAISEPLVEAGEDIRWLPRARASMLLLPGNDFFVLDDKTVIFNVLGGDDQHVDVQVSSDPEIVDLCVASFEAAWKRSIPYHEYLRTL
ncbi:DUF6879 family protein [Actinocorallia sp. A-T 12471]|uniref:DUF6879 family protein n=1 Tax=Actinocorallia sp. A-T 12471 TaxID=3089813 RepID=UPI0029D24847|nr:DUF6879 family protein [Actinocorallia sp. A-T 12471]MDX6739207.1 hypothetical protein [Actinocorallia sp. A-T 12471]